MTTMMRAVQAFAPGDARFVEAPKPTLKPGHVLVRTMRLSLCGSDIWMLDHGAPESYPFPPGTSGHEIVGVVEAIDAPDSDVKVGDVALVFSPPHLGMAEYLLAAVEHVFVLPEGRPINELLQAQQLGTVIFSAKELPNVVGKDVAVIGQGSVGLWWNFLLQRMGARRVIALDLQEKRVAAASIYGATHAIHNRDIDAVAAIKEITGGDLVDIVIEAAGDESSINLAFDLVKHDGFILIFGVPHGQQMNLNVENMFMKCPTIKCNVGAASEPGYVSTHLAIEMINDGTAPVAPMLTHSFAFDDVLDAYELQRTRDEGAIKIIVEMPE